MPYDTMGMGDDMGAGGGSPAAAPPAPEEHEDNPGTIFLSKEALGGRTVKVGETLNLTVKSVDPETSDVEAMIEKPSGDGAGMAGGPSEFDQKFPPGEEGAE